MTSGSIRLDQLPTVEEILDIAIPLPERPPGAKRATTEERAAIKKRDKLRVVIELWVAKVASMEGEQTEAILAMESLQNQIRSLAEVKDRLSRKLQTMATRVALHRIDFGFASNIALALQQYLDVAVRFVAHRVDPYYRTVTLYSIGDFAAMVVDPRQMSIKILGTKQELNLRDIVLPNKAIDSNDLATVKGYLDLLLSDPENLKKRLSPADYADLTRPTFGGGWWDAWPMTLSNTIISEEMLHTPPGDQVVIIADASGSVWFSPISAELARSIQEKVRDEPPASRA